MRHLTLALLSLSTLPILAPAANASLEFCGGVRSAGAASRQSK